MWSYLIFFMILHGTNICFFIFIEFHVIVILEDLGYLSFFLRFIEISLILILVSYLFLVMRIVWLLVFFISTSITCRNKRKKIFLRFFMIFLLLFMLHKSFEVSNNQRHFFITLKKIIPRPWELDIFFLLVTFFIIW